MSLIKYVYIGGEEEKGVYGANLFLLNFVLKCLECTMLGRMLGRKPG